MSADSVYVDRRLVSRPRYKLVYIRRCEGGSGPSIAGFRIEQEAAEYSRGVGPTVWVEQRQLRRRVGPGFSMWCPHEGDYYYLDALLRDAEDAPPGTLRLDILRGR